MASGCHWVALVLLTQAHATVPDWGAQIVYNEALDDVLQVPPETDHLHLPTSLVAEMDPIRAWNDQLDTVKNMGSGLYWEFDSNDGERVFSGQVEGRVGTYAAADTVFQLASVSKLFTGVATMITMERRPQDWYPNKFVNEFPGWENFANFKIHEGGRANLTVYHLMTHTSGLPFGLRVSKSDLEHVTLFYEPGTQFGYTLGHRVIGWLLRDYWKAQPEAQAANIQTVGDCFKWLLFDKLNLTDATKFNDALKPAFGLSGQAADASIQSTGEDFMKLAVLALRRGKLPSGEVLISEENWNKWAVPNLLPGGKLSDQLVDWKGKAATWYNFNVGGLKDKIMKNAGAYGWSFFGATWYDSKELGWCGFFSSCLRISYTQDVAFVVMQQDIADLKKSKPYMREHFDTMAQALQCQQKACADNGELVICESCTGTSCQDAPWSRTCPSETVRGTGIAYANQNLNSEQHTCYKPHCQSGIRSSTCPKYTGKNCFVFGMGCDASATCIKGRCECSSDKCAVNRKCVPTVSPTSTALCRADTGGTCGVLGCKAKRGPTTCVNGKCVCQEGFCATSGQCVQPPFSSSCLQNTGGTCSYFGCRSSRNAVCVKGSCQCRPGTCAHEGTCKPSAVVSNLLAGNVSTLSAVATSQEPQMALALMMPSALAGILITGLVIASRMRGRDKSDNYAMLADEADTKGSVAFL